MSLFSKRKKRPKSNSDELTVKRTEISSDGEKIEGIYGEDEPVPVNKRYKRAAFFVGISKYNGVFPVFYGYDVCVFLGDNRGKLQIYNKRHESEDPHGY